jgi:hypothetical protein
MTSFAPDPSSRLAILLVHVYQAGDLFVRYKLLSGEMPPQLPVIFGNREELAQQLRELDLVNEAALVTLAEEECDLSFRVALTPELKYSLGFDRPTETVN